MTAPAAATSTWTEQVARPDGSVYRARKGPRVEEFDCEGNGAIGGYLVTRTHDVDVAVAEGESIEDAVAALPWDPAEIAVVGSSRLAQPRRLFLGNTAAKMLHELPVPLIVVPRTLDASTENTEGGR